MIEMLIVVAIIAIIMALGFSALMLAPRSARIKGTEATIAKIDAKLAQLLSEFGRRRSNITPIAADTMLAGGVPQRARLIAAKRSMRQEFPEMFYFDSTRTTGNVNNDGDSFVDEADEVIVGDWNPIDADGDGVPDQSGTELPAAAVGYLRYVERIFADPDGFRRDPGSTSGRTFYDTHQPGTARAECLYMIITNCGADTSEFTSDEIRDTDQDGIPEFVDRFGSPIQFYLWPVYFGANSITTPPPALSSSSPRQNPGTETDADDPNQLLTQRDWWDTNASRTSPRVRFETLFHGLTHFVGGGWQPKGFKTYPLIVSAGPDGNFGFRCDPSFVGIDGAMGSLDDTDPVGAAQKKIPAIGLMLSPGPDGKPETTLATGDDGTTRMPSPSIPIRFSAALRIFDPSIEGYGMDDDNIDNHRLKVK
jgi:type II secretory pathway pseudopilin PulG